MRRFVLWLLIATGGMSLFTLGALGALANAPFPIDLGATTILSRRAGPVVLLKFDGTYRYWHNGKAIESTNQAWKALLQGPTNLVWDVRKVGSFTLLGFRPR